MTTLLQISASINTGTGQSSQLANQFVAAFRERRPDAKIVVRDVGAAGAAQPLPPRAAGVLSDGDDVRVQAGAEGVRFLMLAATPLHEPVVQYGPFVMNTREEIEQALDDYRNGRLATAV